MAKISAKSPIQERSRQTVDAILESSARILSQEGIESFTTNRVAEKAGVSIGSLYQFFRNKESIVEQLFTKVLDENLERFFQLLERKKGLSLESAIRDGIEILFDGFANRGMLTHALFEHAPRLIGPKRFQKIDERIIPRILSRMDELGIRIGPEDREMAIFVVIQSVRGTVSMTFARRESPGNRERIKAALNAQCLAYLK